MLHKKITIRASLFINAFLLLNEVLIVYYDIATTLNTSKPITARENEI